MAHVACEVRYYCHTVNQLNCYLGCHGTFIENMNIPKYFGSSCNDFVTKHAQKIASFLEIQESIEIPDDATIKTFKELGPRNSVILNIWLSNDNGPKKSIKPLLSSEIDTLGHKINKSITSYSWRLYLGANFVNDIENLLLFLPEFKKINQIIPSAAIIRFMIFQDEVYSACYLHTYLLDIKKTREPRMFNNTKYIYIELCYINIGWYYKILREDRNKEEFSKNNIEMI